jgi:hypothetical protein
MRCKAIFLISFISVLLACNKVGIEPEPDPLSFLTENSMKLDELIGEWVWVSSVGGFTGSIVLTPESEGYSQNILFTSTRVYIELIDGKIVNTNYFKIEKPTIWKPETPIYKLTFFDNSKDSVNVRIYKENETDYLYMYDLSGCRDCIGTNVFQKINLGSTE